MAKAIREAYAEALVEYGVKDARVVVLDADVSNSTKTAVFGKACPERFFNVGIAETNMTAMAAGFAAVGMIPFANTFAAFITSFGLEPINAFGSYSQLPMKIAGAYGGLSDAFDGPSHHSLSDVAIMRSLPNVEVYVPSDAAQTRWLVKYAIDTPKPIYLRLSRDTMPDCHREDTRFEAGKGIVLRDGTDATVMACGLMVSKALAAAEELADSGISVRVVDMCSIKPIDRALIEQCARETGVIVSAEEHSVIGGLGSAIAEVLATGDRFVPMEFVGMQDCHAECGPYAALQKKYGLDEGAVVRAIRRGMERKA